MVILVSYMVHHVIPYLIILRAVSNGLFFKNLVLWIFKFPLFGHIIKDSSLSLQIIVTFKGYDRAHQAWGPRRDMILDLTVAVNQA